MPVSRTTGGKARMALPCWDNRRQLCYFYTREIPNLTKTEPLTYVLCGCLCIWPQSVRIKMFKTGICPVTREMAFVLYMQCALTSPPTTGSGAPKELYDQGSYRSVIPSKTYTQIHNLPGTHLCQFGCRAELLLFQSLCCAAVCLQHTGLVSSLRELRTDE